MWWSESLQGKKEQKNRYLSASSPLLWLLLIVRDFFKFFASLSNQKIHLLNPSSEHHSVASTVARTRDQDLWAFETSTRPASHRVYNSFFPSFSSFLTQRLVFSLLRLLHQCVVLLLPNILQSPEWYCVIDDCCCTTLWIALHQQCVFLFCIHVVQSLCFSSFIHLTNSSVC